MENQSGSHGSQREIRSRDIKEVWAQVLNVINGTTSFRLFNF